MITPKEHDCNGKEWLMEARLAYCFGPWVINTIGDCYLIEAISTTGKNFAIHWEFCLN